MTKRTGKPRGRKGWAQGSMLEFLMSRRGEYKAARKADAAGPFYSKMAKLWAIRYDWKLPSAVDPKAAVIDPDDSVLQDDVGQDLEEAEIKRREEILKELRHKIGAWFRHHCGKVLKADGANEMWATGLLQAAVEPPKRAQPWQYYSRKYYDMRVRPTVEKEWAEKVQKAAQELKPPLTKDDLFAHWVSVTRRRFQFDESREFKKALQEEIEEEYLRAMEEYHDRYVRDPSTPKQFHLALNSCYMTLQPIVDLIARRYGMVATLTLAGPVPSKNGAIEAFTVHAGTTYEVHGRAWPEFDNKAHTDFCSAYVAFAEKAFSKC
ncbi:hypothetical protein BV25DRAFT_1922152 [Artomyces pyxidatus]|uniref:Uncharacterized protein n=1 Tax=Artomyces pyxidatus TaxID=48021 RepID=A0ACB8SFA3_9AGAM|nr:hypothetical protein BV25DRAFT_1922152 [Artomyces pyxidatus]